MSIDFSPDFLSDNQLSRLGSIGIEDDDNIELPDLIDDEISELNCQVDIEMKCETEEIPEIFTNKVLSRRSTKMAPMNCKVCGYPTTCLHYEAPSCHACKTFYRRSVLTCARYVCKLNRQCDIQAGDRCRSCRYDQCFRAGMNPESIRLVVESTSDYLTAIQLAKSRKREIEQKEWIMKREIKVPVKFIPQFEQTSDSRTVDFLTHLELKYTQLRESTYTASEFYNSDIRELLRSQCQLGNADKYGPRVNLPVQSTITTLQPPKRSWFIFDLILNLEYLKALPFFHQLNLDDQECLAMHVVMVNTTLSEAWYSFKNNYTTMIMPDGSIPINMRGFFNVPKIYPTPEKIELETFCRSTEPLFRVLPNSEEYSFLKAIIYCHSESPGLSEHAKSLLNSNRQIFASALLRRIQARLGAAEGAKKYSEVIGLIETFFYFGQKHREFQIFVNYVCQRLGSPRKLPSLTDWFIKNSSKFD